MYELHTSTPLPQPRLYILEANVLEILKWVATTRVSRKHYEIEYEGVTYHSAGPARR